MVNLRIKIAFLIFLIFSLSLVVTSAFVINDGYKIKGVISGGGRNLTGAYGLKLAIGQPITGTTYGNYKVCFGFFCMLASPGENVMNFTGSLNYSNGEPVKNSLIRITLKNETLGFERVGTSQTDDLGNFFIKITGLPLNIMSSNLNISFQVIGEVEAIYECYYSVLSGKCS